MAASPPTGRILFQPQLLWANSMTTLQGTGYVITHGGRFFGATAVHYLDFNAGGLGSATWLDVYSERPLATFRSSLGRPLRATFNRPNDVADDFLLLPASQAPDDSTPLELENVAHYETGTRLWFPCKSRDLEVGHRWLDATLIDDPGHLIRVHVRDADAADSIGGTPVLNAETARVIGMVHRAEETNGRLVLTLCPARALVRHLARRQPTVSLMTSISRRR